MLRFSVPPVIFRTTETNRTDESRSMKMIILFVIFIALYSAFGGLFLFVAVERGDLEVLRASHSHFQTSIPLLQVTDLTFY